MRRRLGRLRRLAVRAAASIVLAGLLIRATHGQPPPSPRPAGPAPLARYFPRKDLVVYAEFDGLDAHRDAWTKSAAYRLLTETTTGAMLEQSAARLIDQLTISVGSPVPANGRELVALGKHLMLSGFAVGINRAGGEGLPRCLGLVIRGGARDVPRTTFERFLRAGVTPRSRIRPVEKPGGRTVQVLEQTPGRATAWWSEGDDLVVSLVSSSGVDAILGALDGREPSAVDHPTRLALKKGEDASGFDPVGLAFFDMAALPPLPREAAGLGLDRIERFDYRWGFHGTAIQSILGAVVPSPRAGIPALFDQPTFDVRHLPPLPGGLSGFTVFSLDALRLYDQADAAIRVIDPRATQPLGAINAMVKGFGGLNLRDDLLAHLGSRVVLYTVPTRINAPPNVLAGVAHALAFAPRSSVVIEVKDPKGIERALEAIARELNKPVPVAPDQGSTFSLSLNMGSMQRMKGPDVGYVFPPSSSFTFPMGMRQTMLLGRKTLVWGMSPVTARRARDLAERPDAQGLPPGDPLAAALDNLPGRLTFLSVSDERQSILPDVLVSVPNLIDLPTAMESLAVIGFEFGVDLTGLRAFPSEVPPAVDPFQSAPPTPAVPATGKPPGGRDPAPTPAFDPELIPEPDDLRPFLSTSVSVLAVDERGIRFISREALPTINPATMVPVALAMLVPALNASRIAAQRAQSVNSLKQIGLAMQGFHDPNGHFPADIRGKDGKPLLSWRVRLLPFLEQQALFNEFKLDEPWDGPHNKPLLERMPSAFAIPGATAVPGMTFYRGISGKHALFDPMVPEGVKMESITDGTSNTIAAVEARQAVPWTRPETEIPFDESLKPEQLQPLRDALGGHADGGFNVLFCDGSVRFIKDTINLTILRLLITRDVGEVVSASAF
jgi:prepilin-type processing-associated H-X9-DG protein